jgi:hypothetical protein
MEIPSLTDEEEKELYRLSKFYWSEAVRCENANAYLAGCVMLGSALETLLILMINIFGDEAMATAKVPMHKGSPKPLFDWSLAELLKVAKSANWLPSKNLPLDGNWGRKRGAVGDYAEMARMIRNLLHPARYTQDHFRKRITSRILQSQFDVVLLCRDWLVARNNEGLFEAIKEEEERQAVAKLNN